MLENIRVMLQTINVDQVSYNPVRKRYHHGCFPYHVADNYEGRPHVYLDSSDPYSLSGSNPSTTIGNML